MGSRRGSAVWGVVVLAASVAGTSPAHAVVWTWWLGAGAGGRGLQSGSQEAVLAPRAGLSLMPTVFEHVSRWHMLLVGPWLGAETQLDEVLGEGGVEVTIAPIHADDMMYGLRLGGGYEYRSAGRAAALSATVLIGFRNAPWSSCDLLALAHGVRVFATVRDTRGQRGLSMLVGAEIEPSLLFPPYSRRAFVGWGGNAGCSTGM